MSSLFQANDYFRYRSSYPASVFQALRPYLRPQIQVLDVGAGTGYSAASFLKFFSSCKMALLEPDEAMLATAVKELCDFPQVTCALRGSAEKIPFADASVDLIIVASAWHWMNFAKAIAEFERVLTAGGVVFIFEYQFPKATAAHAELNEWVRRQFNLYWRAPAQAPRGSLFEITEGLRHSSAFAQQAKIKLVESQNHSLESFAGLIFSQSRFLHYESSLFSAPGEARGRGEVITELKKKWSLQNEIEFLYPYEGFVFQKRV